MPAPQATVDTQYAPSMIAPQSPEAAATAPPVFLALQEIAPVIAAEGTQGPSVRRVLQDSMRLMRTASTIASIIAPIPRLAATAMLILCGWLDPSTVANVDAPVVEATMVLDVIAASPGFRDTQLA